MRTAAVQLALVLLMVHAALQDCFAAASGLQVRVSQSDFVFAREAREPGNGYTGLNPYFDVFVPNIAIMNSGSETVTLERAWIELSAHGHGMETSVIREDEIKAALEAYTEYSKLNFPVALNVEFGAAILLNGGVKVSESPSMLKSNTAVLVTDSFLLVRGLPDQMTVHAEGHDAHGRAVVGQTSLRVVRGQSRNAYIFPVEAGDWYVTGLPGIDGHHRFTQATEFAIDITRGDDHGRWRRGRERQWTDWYAYGAKVLAAADGVVVAVVNDSDIDLKTWMQRDGESQKDYEERLSNWQLQRFLKPGADPSEVAGGNYVTLKHANGEYSHYAHLAFHSVAVKVGDKVRQGQTIARIGGTGERPEVHLHFQVSDSTDTKTYSMHSIPVSFTNASRPALGRHSDETGYFVAAK